VVAYWLNVRTDALGFVGLNCHDPKFPYMEIWMPSLLGFYPSPGGLSGVFLWLFIVFAWWQSSRREAEHLKYLIQGRLGLCPRTFKWISGLSYLSICFYS